MAGSGHLRSQNLRDMKGTVDLLKGMIRELKRGRRRLRSQIKEAIRKLEESKKMRDELMELSSAINNYTHTEATEPETHTNESVLSQEENLVDHEEENVDMVADVEKHIDLVVNKKDNIDLVHHEDENIDMTADVEEHIDLVVNKEQSIDLVDHEDENMLRSGTEMSCKINISINRSGMSVESLQSPVESLSSMECVDSLSESFEGSIESIDFSEEGYESSMDCSDFSEDEFLDAEDSEWIVHSSMHPISERNVLEDTQRPIATTSTADENSQSFEQEKTNSKEEDVIGMWINDYKKKMVPFPRNLNIFENLHDKHETNVSNVILTNDNSEPLQSGDFDGERKSNSSSLSSNVNISEDPFQQSNWCMDIETTITVNLKSLEEEQFSEKKIKHFGVEDELGCEEECIDCSNLGDEIIIRIVKVENENPKLFERTESRLEKENFTGLQMNSYDKGNATGDHQNQINENESRILTEVSFHSQKNHDKEVDGAFRSYNWSSFESLIKHSENRPINIEPSENICSSLDKNIKLSASWANSQPETYATNHCGNTKFYEINSAMLNEDLYPAERKLEDCDIKNKSQDANEINFFTQIDNWEDNCEKAELIKISSELSTDGLHLNERVVQNFLDNNALIGCLESDSPSQIPFVSPSLEDMSEYVNAVGSSTEDSVALEIKNTAPLASTSKSQDTNEINFFTQIDNWTDNCEKAELIKTSSELSTDGLHLNEKVVQNFVDNNALIGCLESDSPSQLPFVSASLEDISEYVNAVGRSSEGSAASEIESTAGLASASKVPEPDQAE